MLSQVLDLHWTRVLGHVPVVGYFWRLFTSVRFAILLIAILAVGCTLGVVISQVPIELSSSPADVALWLEQEARPRYQNFTNVMHMLGLFDVFHSAWFRASLVLLTVAIVVCTLNRFPAIYQSTVKAKPTVPEGFMRSAKHRGLLALPDGPAPLVDELKRRGYRLTVTPDGDKLHIYADKNGWAKYMTFVSHLGLLLFMFGGLMTNLAGYQRFLVIPRDQSQPIYPVYHPEQMQVLNKGFTVEYYEDGRPRDYYSDLVIYKGGQEVASGRIRVNTPLDYDGFRFHQNSFGPTVDVEVRNADTGQVLLSETLVLSQAFGTTPYEVIEVPTTNITAIVALAEGFAGGNVVGGTFVRGGQQARLAVMGFAADNTSGTPSDPSRARPDIVLRLAPGESVTQHGLTFTFGGLDHFTGVVARKDPGAVYIWIAACLFVPAVWITFWLARRRLWVQVVGQQARIAGMADRFVDLQKEIDEIVTKLGGGPPQPGPHAPQRQEEPAFAGG